MAPDSSAVIDSEVVADLKTIYADTMVAHYLGAGGPQNQETSKNSLTALIDQLDSSSIVCVTSDIALVEEYDTYKGRAFYRRELKRGNIDWRNHALTFRHPKEVGPLSKPMRIAAIREAQKWLNKSEIRLKNPPAWPSELVITICGSTDLHWPDALHLAMALAMRCDIFLTNDSDFYDEMNRNLHSSSAGLHKSVASVLNLTYGLPWERLEVPLIEPLLLKDGASAGRLRSL